MFVQDGFLYLIVTRHKLTVQASCDWDGQGLLSGCLEKQHCHVTAASSVFLPAFLFRWHSIKYTAWLWHVASSIESTHGQCQAAFVCVGFRGCAAHSPSLWAAVYFLNSRILSFTNLWNAAGSPFRLTFSWLIPQWLTSSLGSRFSNISSWSGVRESLTAPFPLDVSKMRATF